MACYHPLTAYYAPVGVYAKSQKRLIVFKSEYGDPSTEMKLPCGQCIGCRLERSRQWAIRCQHEASLYKQNCFLTLTYDDAHLPTVTDRETGELVGSLNKRDIMLFLKRLRKANPEITIRFFQCGEYGELCKNCNKPQYLCTCGNFTSIPGRPHHHALIFNFDFKDKLWWKKVNGQDLYTSKELQRLWPYGISAIGKVTFESAAYCARYVTKKINGDRAELHYGPRLPEFITMSRRPGIGRDWYDKYCAGVYPHDYVVLRNLKMRPPKYYDKLFELQDNAEFCRIKLKRQELAKDNPDNTPQRLADREAVKLSKAKMLVRRIEMEG